MILGYHSVNRALMGNVNPVIWTVERAVNHVLRICKRKTGKDFFADISLAASLRIFEKPHVGSGGHQHAPFPTHDAVRHDDVIRKDGASIGKSIAVGILEQHNAAYRSSVQWIAGVLCHINAPILVQSIATGLLIVGSAAKGSTRKPW